MTKKYKDPSEIELNIEAIAELKPNHYGIPEPVNERFYVNGFEIDRDTFVKIQELMRETGLLPK
jgi:hypothetical protein